MGGQRPVKELRCCDEAVKWLAALIVGLCIFVMRLLLIHLKIIFPWEILLFSTINCREIKLAQRKAMHMDPFVDGEDSPT